MVEKSIVSVKRLRLIGILEGISFLFLLTIAMPLKYYFHYPMAVKITGWIHGMLFVLYIITVLKTAFVLKWNLKKIFVFLIASVIPSAPFFLDRMLKQDFSETRLS